MATSRNLGITNVKKAAKLLAKTPTLTNAELIEALKFNDAYAFTQARKTLGIHAPPGQPAFVRIVHATYYKACRDLRVPPLRIPESGVFSRHRDVESVPEQVGPKGEVLAPVVRRFSQEDILTFVARNPAATNKDIVQHFRTNSVAIFIANVRLKLGYRYIAQPRGFQVDRKTYLATCALHGVEPVEMPEQDSVFFPVKKSNASRAVSTVATVPTSDVPPAVLADTPRDLRPATPEEKPQPDAVIAQEGNDQYAQLRALVTLLRTEMAKRGIDTVRIEPGGVTVRRTVVVEEPFV
jgi:hypothetical protein